MNVLTFRLLGLAAATTILTFSACKKEEAPFPTSLEQQVKDYPSDVLQGWNDLFLVIERYADGYRPGPAPRTLAYLGLAAYEAALPGMSDEYQSLEPLYRDQGLRIPLVEEGESYHWPTVVNASYAALMKQFFPHVAPDLKFRIYQLEAQNDEAAIQKISRSIFERSKRHGESVAGAVFLWSASDVVGHNAFLNARPNTYFPPSGPGLWQPTYPDYSKGLFPFWGNARTLAIRPTDKLALPPLPYSEQQGSLLRNEAMVVYNLNTPALSFEQRWIAEFWSDDALNLTFSPPSRFIAIANQVLKKENANLALGLYACLKVGLALNDAGIACWHSKYVYNYERPVSYIRRVIAPNWEPHNPFTPSFPAYPSGHATFGAAAAEVLSNVFGESYSMEDNSHIDRTDFLGMPRAFDSFREMAEENAYSRLPLGVHFRMDAVEGVRHGYQIGRRVNELPIKR